MRRILVTLACLAASVAIAGDSEGLEGAWALRVLPEDTARPDTHEPQILLFDKTGEHFTVTDLRTRTAPGQVVIRPDTLIFPLYLIEGKEAVMAHGSLDGKRLSGTAVMNGRAFHFQAAKLASLWYCSNHKPKDIATTEKEMRALSDVKKCKGWHRASFTAER